MLVNVSFIFIGNSSSGYRYYYQGFTDTVEPHFKKPLLVHE